jgi:hypothetical protein
LLIFFLLLKQKTQELTQEQDALRRTFQELLNEKIRLENLLISHEKVCNGNNSNSNSSINNRVLPSQKTINTNNNNNSNNNLNAQQNAALTQQQQQNLLKIKKEELDEIIKQSNERKNQKLSLNQNYNDQQQHHIQHQIPKLNIQSKFEAALNHSFNDKNFNLLLLPGAHQQTAHHLAAQTTAIVTPNSANHLETILNHFDLTKKVLTPTSNPMNIQQQFHQMNQQQQQSNHNSNNQYSPFQPPSQMSNSPIQRPNNLSLKTPSITTSASSPSSFSSNQLITPSLATTVLMQNLALNLFGSAVNSQNSQMLSNNANNISLLMTPTLQLNTPTLFALTPLESAFNSFNNCNTPIIQQTPMLSSIPIDQNSSSNSTSSKT